MYGWDLGFRLSLLGSHYVSTNLIFYYETKKSGPLEKVCGYRSTIKILFCPFIKLNNG